MNSTAPSSTVRRLAEADLRAGRITETVKAVVVFDTQYAIDEYDCSANEAAEDIADQYGVRFHVILEIIAGRVRD